MLTVGSLFAGIGGFDLGFERAGMSCAWQVEIDDRCQNVLRSHYPAVPRFGDVRDCGSHNLTHVDVISFGSPCQDLSVAGKRAGLDGERSGLFYEAARIVQELRPTYTVWENVPGALSSNHGLDFKSAIEALLLTSVPMPRSGRWAKSGMVRTGQKEIAWRILDAQYFGLAQRRRRLFLILCPRDGGAPEILFEREGCCWDTPPSRETGQGVAGTLEARTTGDGFPSTDGAASGHVVAMPITHRIGKGGFTDPVNDNIIPFRTNQTGAQGPIHSEGVTDSLAQDHPPAVAFGLSENQRAEVRLTDYSRQITSGGGKPGQGYPAVFTTCWEMQHASEAYREAGDIAPNPQARMGTGGNNVPLVGVRRLTPTECERLQGFPDGWTGEQSDSARYKQLGNAVAVPCSEWIGKRIIDITRQ